MPVPTPPTVPVPFTHMLSWLALFDGGLTEAFTCL